MGFAGSVETGRIVAREAVEKFKGATLELGDEYPIVIIPDADPKKAAATLRPVGGDPCREGINGPLAEECGFGYHLSRDPEEMLRTTFQRLNAVLGITVRVVDACVSEAGRRCAHVTAEILPAG